MTNLFEQFEGADLNRLTDCLKAIRAAGLSVDKYTQAGVNQNSGNVWVMSEDWPGCVYCSIGFDVAWSYSCGECGKEHDFESYSEMEEYAERYPGACKECKPKFVAGWNMSGYMPDVDPQEFDDADEAMDYIREEMRKDTEENAPEAEVDALLAQIDTFDADAKGEFGLTFGAYHYFVTKEA